MYFILTSNKIWVIIQISNNKSKAFMVEGQRLILISTYIEY